MNDVRGTSLEGNQQLPKFLDSAHHIDRIDKRRTSLEGNQNPPKFLNSASKLQCNASQIQNRIIWQP